MKIIMFFLLTLFASCACHDGQKTELNGRRIMGWIEYAKLENDVFVKAKLDTGAKTSSIHGTNIKSFKKNGKKWVRFTFEEVDEKTQKIFKKVYEKKVIRHVLIKDHKAKSRRRPVVAMDFEIGGKSYTTQFSVTDRNKFIYPLLLGRRFLKDVAYIDPSSTFTLLKFKEEPLTK